jgi:uncharacterized protein
MEMTRPWPAPAKPPVMRQRWHDLLFAHWRVPLTSLRPLVPAELPLDTRAGSAWVAVTPFRMTGVWLAGFPALPGVSRFPELNVRTYVTLDDKPGVYFFSLDAGNALAVAGARGFFRLPYHWSRMSAEPGADGIAYRSERRGKTGVASFEARYAPDGPVFSSIPGTLEHWLTERYCLYTAARGKVHRVEIDHEPWPLQPARAEITRNTMAAAAGLLLTGDPLLHFARDLEVGVWMPDRVR